MEESFVVRLREVIGEDKLIVGERICEDYCHDEYSGKKYAPDAVAEVTSTDDVVAVMKLCRETGTPVTVRGAGTGQMGGSVAVSGGVVLSTKRMDAIISVDEVEKTMTVQAGVTLQAVKSEADRHGLYYAPDPGEKTATIGGNAATNAGGPSAIKYGCTKDYVADAELVFADGTTARLKDNEGNMAVIGSEGTLAVITELTVRLVEKPKADAILLFPFMDNKACLNAAATIAAAGYSPAIAEYMDTDIIEFAGKTTGNPVFPVKIDGERPACTLMVTLEGESEDDVMEKLEQIAEMAEELECLDILVGDTPTMKRDFWAAHDAFHTAMESGAKNAAEYNITVPFNRIAQMAEYAKTLGNDKSLKVMSYAHLLSGGMHIHAVSDCTKEEYASVIPEFSAAIYAKCCELQGDIRGEYGYGYAKQPYMSETAKKQAADNRAKFDPSGIMNPGKL